MTHPPSDRLQIESFLEMLAAERGASHNTLQSYARDLEAFLEFAQDNTQKLMQADKETVRAYLNTLQKRVLKKRPLQGAFLLCASSIGCLQRRMRAEITLATS